VVHWRSNLFLVPWGKVGKDFVQELARLISAYGEGSALESIAIKAAMILCTLLLQRPYKLASTADFVSCLKQEQIPWSFLLGTLLVDISCH